MRTKLGLLGLCAVVVGMMSMSAGAAQGATLSWLILNSTHTTATELKAEVVGEKDSEHLSLVGEVAGFKVALTCTNVTAKETFLTAAGTVTGGKVVFTGCKVYETAPLTKEFECTINSVGAAAGTVETAEVKGELQLHTKKDGTKLLVTRIEPKVGGLEGTLASLKFSGPTCVLPNAIVHGALYLKDCEGFETTHKLRHLVEDLGELTSLYIGGHSAKQLERTKIIGSAWIKLGGAHAGLEWSGMDV